MILQIKSQGYPGILEDLGVQSPFSGPFWGFEPTILPVVVVQDNGIQQNVGMPYLPANLISDTSIDPPATHALIQTPNLPAGKYAFQLDLAWANGAATANFILFKVRNFNGTVIRTTTVAGIANTGAAGNVGARTSHFVEHLAEGDFIYIESLNVMVPGDMRSTLRWNRLSAVDFINA